jgi:hypothetical protein
LRRATIARAAMLTARVMTNSASPVAMSVLTPSGFASGNCSAMFAAIVWCWPACSRANEYSAPGLRIMSTAMVSPSARPRPSMAAETMPDRPNGRTAIRIISQRVAPRASAASSCSRGAWRNTSRHTAVMIGRIIAARTTPTVRMTRGGEAAGPANSGTQPNVPASHCHAGSSRGASQMAPHRPYTTLGIAARRSTRYPRLAARRRGA